MNDDQQINQTQFAFEEPIYEDRNVEMPVEKPVENDPTEKKEVKRKQKAFLAIVILLIFVSALIILITNGKETVEEAVVNDPEKIEEELSPLMIRIEKLRVELEEADPTKQDLVFPPVDMELRLDLDPNK